jgi:hypothetical protein
MGYISAEQVLEQAHRLGKSEYSKYLTDLVSEHDMRV